jgi:hypothetical protein
MVDPSNSMNVVHFMLLKPAVIQIAEEVNNDGQAAASDGLMDFPLHHLQMRPRHRCMII